MLFFSKVLPTSIQKFSLSVQSLLAYHGPEIFLAHRNTNLQSPAKNLTNWLGSELNFGFILSIAPLNLWNWRWPAWRHDWFPRSRLPSFCSQKN